MTKQNLESLMEGVLPVFKPVDFTSHDVVAKVRRIVRIKRIGHTGTLDPKVTGVLPLCIGRATRVVEYIQDLPKEYEAELLLGIATDTEDMTGNIIQKADCISVSEQSIERVIRSCIGEIEQIPPMYSAVKVDGKRLYDLARQGIEVERKSRKVTIHRIDILKMDLTRPHPLIRMKVLCSKGTYIRTLCVDIGKALGVPSTMAELVRTSTGSITLDQCLTFEEIERRYREGTLDQAIIPADQAIRHLPAVYLKPSFVKPALQGQKMKLASLVSLSPIKDDRLFRLYATDETFLGIFMLDITSDTVKPVKVFT